MGVSFFKKLCCLRRRGMYDAVTSLNVLSVFLFFSFSNSPLIIHVVHVYVLGQKHLGELLYVVLMHECDGQYVKTV